MSASDGETLGKLLQFPVRPPETGLVLPDEDDTTFDFDLYPGLNRLHLSVGHAARLIIDEFEYPCSHIQERVSSPGIVRVDSEHVGRELNEAGSEAWGQRVILLTALRPGWVAVNLMNVTPFGEESLGITIRVATGE